MNSYLELSKLGGSDLRLLLAKIMALYKSLKAKESG
jgi:hypothetical protein